MYTLKLTNGKTVSKEEYIHAKFMDLKESYPDLTEKTVAEQVEKILANDKDLSVIGKFCEDDIDFQV